jgi:hypothetical protein
MAKRLLGVELVPTDDNIRNGLLVVLGDGLGHSPDLGSDQEGELERHGIVGDLHLRVPDGQLDLGSHQFGVLVDGNLVHRWIVLLLLLLSLLLLFLGGHASTRYK